LNNNYNKILAIHDGHNASVCFIQGTEIIALVNEERFTNVKNQGGFPIQSIKWILKEYDLTLNSISKIVFPHLNKIVNYDQGKETSFERKVFETLSNLFPQSILSNKHLFELYGKIYGRPARKIQIKNNFIKSFDENVKFEIIEHHLTHAYASVATSGFLNNYDKFLVFTADTSGDGLSSTVSICNSDGALTRISQSSAFDSLCKMYSQITEMMGMKPNEHEYKIMGMSPYAEKKYAKGICNILTKLVFFDEKSETFKSEFAYGAPAVKKLHKLLYKKRFDSIAAGTQLHFEQMIQQWINHWVSKTGIKVSVFGGGGFMNVKSNMLISKQAQLDDYYFCPSSGDESTSLGAAYYEYLKTCKNREPFTPIDNLYLGREYSDRQILKELKKWYEIFHFKKCDDINLEVARFLEKGEVIARFNGREEWGARALGNRSILCRTDNPSLVNVLNKKIKMRDFWMPFACSILDKHAQEYFEDYDGKSDQFMMKTYTVKESKIKNLIAGVHPFDGTCRAQVIRKNTTPEYWDLLEKFTELSGISALLNTSFNLHGKPIVGSLDDTLNTIYESGIKYLAIGNYFVMKKK